MTKRILYFIIPVFAFVVILSNAFFGHLIYNSPYDQDINKYSIYVHLQDEWNSYPGNILFDITNVWSNSNPPQKNYSADPSDVSSLIQYNSNELQSQHEKSYVELKHEFSNCESSWKPMLYRYAIDILRNKIQFAQGNQLNDDPYISILPNTPLENQIETASYAQFIPLCTSQEYTSYEYSVSTNDQNLWFHVYFVPSKEQLDSYLNSENFDYYLDEGCSANFYQSFSGVCENVGKDSGLLVIIPDILNQSLTKVKVNLHEKI
ncbi:hypothetical protein C5F50_02000 [Nitrosopumilus ureiphilus]|uniref:Uncharacterized protein n=1 Tax=Nitrosopumilus ureiphilus TaxID=1470067 RepID=A0A7D5RCG5_9ARCH|nr:hypothetical protein C5F50_02000 [Nitrosopumilus ureiphilus]